MPCFLFTQLGFRSAPPSLLMSPHMLCALTRCGSSPGWRLKFRLIMRSDTEVSLRASGCVSNSIKSKPLQTGHICRLELSESQPEGKQGLSKVLPAFSLLCLGRIWIQCRLAKPTAKVTVCSSSSAADYSSSIFDTHRRVDSSFVALSVSRGIQTSPKPPFPSLSFPPAILKMRPWWW